MMKFATLEYKQMHQNSTKASKCDSTEYTVYTLPLMTHMEQIHTSPL